MIYNNCSKARHIIKLESVITPVVVSIPVTKVAVAAHSGGSPNRRRPTRTPNTIRRAVHAHASERPCDAPDATEPRPRQRPSSKGQRSVDPVRPDSQRCPRAWAGAQDDDARARPRARAGRTRTVGRWRSVQAHWRRQSHRGTAWPCLCRGAVAPLLHAHAPVRSSCRCVRCRSVACVVNLCVCGPPVILILVQSTKSAGRPLVHQTEPTGSACGTGRRPGRSRRQLKPSESEAGRTRLSS